MENLYKFTSSFTSRLKQQTKPDWLSAGVQQFWFSIKGFESV